MKKCHEEVLQLSFVDAVQECRTATFTLLRLMPTTWPDPEQCTPNQLEPEAQGCCPFNHEMLLFQEVPSMAAKRISNARVSTCFSSSVINLSTCIFF